MRSASNPGGSSHQRVKDRFVGESLVSAAAEPSEERPAVRWTGGIAFVPARIKDNPAIDEAQYRDSLSYLPTVVRERLLHGDWSVGHAGLIHPEWLRYFTIDGHQLRLRDGKGQVLASVDERRCRRFGTVDPAGTSADRLASGAGVRRAGRSSWSGTNRRTS